MRVTGFLSAGFLFIGLALLAAAAMTYNADRQFLLGAQRTRATVVEQQFRNDVYYPVLEFRTPAGEAVRFVASTGSNPPSWHVGDRLDILYRPEQPRDARLDSFFSLWLGPFIFGLFAAICLLIGGGLLIAALRRRHRDRYLHEHGVPVVSKFRGVEKNTMISSNGHNPYQIVSQWVDPDSNRIYVFRSNDLWFDPTDFIQGDDITVYIQPGNPKKYSMDLSFLPKPGN